MTAATAGFHTLSLHDALPIFRLRGDGPDLPADAEPDGVRGGRPAAQRPDQRGLDRPLGCIPPLARRPVRRWLRRDRKSTRLNSSHANISYAVFCLKKKKTTNT